MKKTDRLVYTGGASSREVSRAEWVAAGVDDQDFVSWNPGNNKQVEVSELSERALEILLDAHGTEFRILSKTEATREDAPVEEKKETAR